MKKINDFISMIIVFCSTAVLPNLLVFILQIDFNVAVLSAIVSVVTILILWLVQQNLALKKGQNATHASVLAKHYHTVRIYAINGRYWADLVDKSSQFEATNCIILIRKYIDGLCDKQRYMQETQESIAVWKKMREERKIGSLTIYEYEHMPDHYFAVLDNKVLVTGLNDFCDLDSTGQLGDRDSKFVFDSEDKKLIEKYVRHFDNYVEHYKKNQIQL